MPQVMAAQINRGQITTSRTGPVRLDHHVLQVFLQGSVTCIHGPLQVPNDYPWLALIPAGDASGYYSPGDCELHSVSFQWKELTVVPHENHALRLHVRGKQYLVARYVKLSPESVDLCTALIADIRRDLLMQDLQGDLRAEERFLRMFRTYVRIAGAEIYEAKHRELARFRELIVAHAYEPTSIEELAGQCGMTAYHLRRLFKQCFGISPGTYRNALRMAYAHDLLASSSLNVTEVARRVGFDDPLYFSRAFRKHYGHAPSRAIRVHPSERSPV